MAKYKNRLKQLLIVFLMLLFYILGALTNAFLYYHFDKAPKYGKVISEFKGFARETFINEGYWPEDIEQFKKFLLENRGERIHAYAVCYDLHIELTAKTNTYAEYVLRFSANRHRFNIVVKK